MSDGNGRYPVGAPERAVGAPTPPPAWEEIRQEGKLLFELDRARGLIRLRRWGREFLVDLARLDGGPLMQDARLNGR